MRTPYLLFLVLLLFVFPYLSSAQGIIRGSVYDDATGEPLFGVTAVIQNTTNGASADFDGKFEIRVAPGTYNLQLSFISYKTLIIEGVNVEANKVTVLDNLKMQEDIETLAEIVITAEAVKSTEEALLTVKRKSANLLDGISSVNFAKIGDSDAAGAVKRVPGVSVEGGKYVYVRGLGDRYTKSTLNGVDVPGLDPDRNTIQMDMFPTSLIDNIIVLKSFTAELPADFTGGIVDIGTKEFPDEKVMSLSLNMGFNPIMHFNADYLTYAGSSTDFLGFDDGMRSIPTNNFSRIPLYPEVVARPDTEDGRIFRSILEGFNPNMGAFKERSLMDFGLGFSLGNQKKVGTNTLGYFFNVDYGNTTEYFSEVKYGRYGKDAPNIFQLDEREIQVGQLGTNAVNLSGLAGVAWKTQNSKYVLNALHTQNGESKAAFFDFEGKELGAVFTADQHNLEYSQRSLTNLLASGTHYFNEGKWEVAWKVSPTLSKLDDPDIRFTRIRNEGGRFTIGSEVGYPERIWRYLKERNLVGKLDVIRTTKFLGRPSKLKFGAAYTYKQRDYNILGFQIIPFGVEATADPDIIFLPENLWPTNTSGTRGSRYEPGFLPINTNAFDSEIRNLAAYISDEFSLSEKLKAIVGVRMEQYEQRYTGQNQQGTVIDNEKVLDDLDFFPTVNLIYALNDRHNIRTSFSRTIARPSFKEASFAEILDPITSRTFIGGFFPDQNAAGEIIWDGNLTATRIDNFDLRWEMFQGKGQTIAVSGFYKRFDDPIEIIQFVQAPNNFQPRNVGDGQVLGLEIELRKNLEFLSPSLENFSINGNLTLVDSRIDMSPTEFNSRVRNAREGQTIKETRQMAGQAPYIINAGMAYSSPANGLDAGLYFNLQGRTLAFVGVADRPDIFAVPFHSLNFNANKTFGPNDRMRAGFKIDNILGDIRRQEFDAFNADSEVFTWFRPGTRFSLRFGYTF